jgi:serine-type D-Ala-D-Ala carboxypeptidase/endopeptidase
MNWEILSGANIANGHTIIMHPGGTGGYSSFVAFDRAATRAVVVLSDTALTDVGGLRMLGLHLLDPGQLASSPRTVAIADVKLIDALAGRYRLPHGPGMELRNKGNTLTIQADGQPEFETGYDSAGDFYALKFDALLRPQRKADGTYTFAWLQLGGVLQAERIGTPAPVTAKWTPAESQLKEYEGDYPLSVTFARRVFSTGPKLLVQGTNQGPVEAAPVEKDIFVTESVGAEIDFERDASGKVIALELKQHGQVLRAERH